MGAEHTASCRPTDAGAGRAWPWSRYRLARYLPSAIRRHLGLANRLVVAWLVISAFSIGLIRATPSTVAAQQLVAGGRVLPQALPLPTTLLAPSRVVKVSSPGGEITIERADDAIIADIGSDQPRLRVEGDAAEARLVGPGGETRFRLEFVDGSKARILDDAGNQLWRVKRELEGSEETFKLYDLDDTIRHRAKVKPDSFNVYGTGSTRVAKGKPRDGGFETRYENGSRGTIVAGDVSLRQAAVLSLPLEPAVRVLLWVQAGE